MSGQALWKRICGRDQANKCGRFISTHWWPVAMFSSAAIFTSIFFPLRSRSISGEAGIICSADGNVIQSDGTRLLWDIDEYFTINLLFPHLTFTQAKVVDACWDIVIGRGGQAVFAVLTYRTLRRSISFTMEQSALSVSTVTSLCCQQIQLVSTWDLSRDLLLQFKRYGHLSTERWHIKACRSGAYIFVCVYVLSFATITSVMTGYRADLTGFFNVNNSQSGMTEPLENIYSARLSLVDGDRVQLPEGLLFPQWGSRKYERELLQTLRDCEWKIFFVRSVVMIHFLTAMPIDNSIISTSCVSKPGTYTCPGPLDIGRPRCSCTSLQKNAGRANVTSTLSIRGKLFDLSEPALNITTIYPIWAWNGQSINVSGLSNASRCVAANQYSWGFSASLLLTFCVWTIIYALLLLSLETEAYLFSRSQRYSHPHSTYQDILSIAAALTARFGDNILDLHPKKLDEMINRHKGSVRLQMEACPLSRVGAMRHRAMMDQAAWDAKENGTHELAVLTQNAESNDCESEILPDSMLEAALQC